MRSIIPPRVVNDGSLLDIACAVFAALLVFGILWLVVAGWQFTNAVVIAAIGVLLSGMLLPGLSTVRSGVPRSLGVTELSHQTVGAHDITVVAFGDGSPGSGGAALRAWLTQHGFVLPFGVKPVLADHASEGWVFAACRLDPAAAADQVAAAPLIFTSRTSEPIYPMRPTGVGKTELAVDLFALADARAKAPGFRLVRCSPHRGRAGARIFRSLRFGRAVL